LIGLWKGLDKRWDLVVLRLGRVGSLHRIVGSTDSILEGIGIRLDRPDSRGSIEGIVNSPPQLVDQFEQLHQQLEDPLLYNVSIGIRKLLGIIPS
jgi:hypothetical protein